MNGLGNILSNFDTVGLNEMDSVKLMNRKECKYVINSYGLCIFLAGLEEQYFIVEIKNETIMPYKSRYYDSPDFKLYTSHQNGKLNRYKVRSRTYELSGTTFMELKFKTNKKRTVKDRVEVVEDYIFSDSMGFLEERLPFSPTLLEEKIQINYNRITLVDKSFSERVTIDTNLNFISPNNKSGFDNLVIIEIKKEGTNKTSVIENKLSEKNIKPFPISKYCLGISQHYSNVKKNLIRIKIKNLNKIINPCNKYQHNMSDARDLAFQKKVI